MMYYIDGTKLKYVLLDNDTSYNPIDSYMTGTSTSNSYYIQGATYDQFLNFQFGEAWEVVGKPGSDKYLKMRQHWENGNQDDEEITKAFLTLNPLDVIHVVNPTEDQMIKAISVDINSVYMLKDFSSQRVRDAVLQEAVCVENIKPLGELSAEDKRTLVKVNPLGITFLDNPSEELKEIAVFIYPDRIGDLEKPSDKLLEIVLKKDVVTYFSKVEFLPKWVQKELLDKSASNARVINNIDLDLAKEIIDKKVSNFYYIQKPSKEVLLYVLQANPDIFEELSNPSDEVKLIVACAKRDPELCDPSDELVIRMVNDGFIEFDFLLSEYKTYAVCEACGTSTQLLEDLLI